MNESIAVVDSIPNCDDANSGKMVLSIPTIPPTNAFTIINKTNCFQFVLSPNSTALPVIFFLYDDLKQLNILSFHHLLPVQIGKNVLFKYPQTPVLFVTIKYEH